MARVKTIDWNTQPSTRAATLARHPELAERQLRSVETRDALAARRKADDADLLSPDPLVRFEAQARRGQLVREEMTHEAERTALKRALASADQETVALMKAETADAQLAAAEAALPLLKRAVEANEALARIDRLRQRFIGGVFGCDALALPTLKSELEALERRIAQRRTRRVA